MSATLVLHKLANCHETSTLVLIILRNEVTAEHK